MAWGGINLGGIGETVWTWMTSLLFWAIIAIIGFVGFIIILKVRRWKRFKFPCIELIGLGQGKLRFINSKCGWFRSKKYFFNLLDVSGEEELICRNRNRKIFYASSVDYHDINGKRGIVVKRKDDDPQVLVPLSKFEIKNFINDINGKQGMMVTPLKINEGKKDEYEILIPFEKFKVKNPELLGEIAPADYRDVSVNLLEQYEKETMTWWQQNAPIIVLAGIVIFALIALIIIFNFAKAESAAWREFAAASRTVVVTASSAAP